MEPDTGQSTLDLGIPPLTREDALRIHLSRIRDRLLNDYAEAMRLLALNPFVEGKHRRPVWERQNLHRQAKADAARLVIVEVERLISESQERETK